MRSSRRLPSAGAVGILLVSALSVGSASAAVIYSQTIINPLATVSTLDDFSNCRDNEGCLGKFGQVFDAAGNPRLAGNLPDTILYTFAFTPADIAAIDANPGQTATLSMTAARDLGLRQGAASNVDFLLTSLDGTSIGNLFGTTVSTCPAGENFNPIDFACGPNYHNDVTAASSLNIPSLLFRNAAADGTVDVLVDPTDDVGRLKVFSLTLQYVTGAIPEPGSIPEPGTLALFVVAGLAASRCRRQ